jgi:hypothetical protein
MLVKSPRSTQPTEQCTPYLRLNPFSLVAPAICSRNPRNEWSTSRYLGLGQAAILVNSPRPTQPTEQCTQYFRLNPFSLVAAAICNRNPRNEWSTRYLGLGQAVILVNSPRSTQPAEQCTPSFRLNPFSLVAAAICNKNPSSTSSNSPRPTQPTEQCTPYLRLNPFSLVAAAICNRNPRNEWSTRYLGLGQAAILVNSPRSTQPTEQCTPYFRLHPFSLVAVAM